MRRGLSTSNEVGDSIRDSLLPFFLGLQFKMEGALLRIICCYGSLLSSRGSSHRGNQRAEWDLINKYTHYGWATGANITLLLIWIEKVTKFSTKLVNQIVERPTNWKQMRRPFEGKITPKICEDVHFEKVHASEVSRNQSDNPEIRRFFCRQSVGYWPAVAIQNVVLLLDNTRCSPISTENF